MSGNSRDEYFRTFSVPLSWKAAGKDKSGGSEAEHPVRKPGLRKSPTSWIPATESERECDSAVHVRKAKATSTAHSSDREQVDDAEKGSLMRHICEIGDFVRRLRVQARFGELSRAPLRLLRVQLRGEHADCDWLARGPDAWDADLPPNVAERNVSMQALQDAITVRELLFRTLPDLQSAEIKVYRKSEGDEPRLIITGVVTRKERPPKAVRSVAMRAKLLGLRFWLDEGILENLQPEAWAVSS